MNLIKLVLTITFIAIPSFAYSQNACMEQAKKNLESCVRNSAESEWEYCRRVYMAAVDRCIEES